MTEQTWHHRTYRKLHLDYHQPHWMSGVAEAMTPELAATQARMIRDSGTEAVEIFVHDHHGFCFFPAEPWGVTHPGLTCDYVELMTAALGAEGLRTMAYMNVFTNVHLKETHPDWILHVPDGRRIGGGWLQYEGAFPFSRLQK
ncbi:MAG: hypothetical protein GY759_12205 [Chloroflexi bacterium]|nr:hypothetical protein [Chloroflexota bacterium]